MPYLSAFLFYNILINSILYNHYKKEKNNQKESAVDLMIQRNGLMIWKTEQWKSLTLNRKKRMKINEDSLRDFWDNFKHINICIIGVPKRKERERC